MIKPTHNYLSPSELIEKYPAVMEKFNWTPRELGLFLKCKLLVGHYDRNKRMAVIQETSFIHLIKYTNQIIDGQKMTI